MITLPTQMLSTTSPRPFAAVATHTFATGDATVNNCWLGGIRNELLDSGSYVAKRIIPGRLAGGLT